MNNQPQPLQPLGEILCPNCGSDATTADGQHDKDDNLLASWDVCRDCGHQWNHG